MVERVARCSSKWGDTNTMIRKVEEGVNRARVDSLLLLELKDKTGLTSRNEEVISLAYFEDEEYAGGIVGQILFTSCYVDLLGVDKAYRGKGIGAQLLSALEAACKQRSIRNVFLTTQDYQAKDFYIKMNYEIAGKLVDVPFEGTTRYILVKNL